MVRTNFRALLHSPEELAEAHLEYATEIRTTPGLKWPVPQMNKRGKCLPLRPGKMATITGRPGHGKSTFLGLMGKYHAQKIVEERKQLDEAIVHVTWEQTVEELESFYQADDKWTTSDIAWGDIPVEVLKEQAAKREHLPVWMIGHSVTKEQQDLPRMTLDIVLETVELMERDYGVKPKLLLMDYIQIIPVSRAKDRVQQVAEVSPRVKEVAGRIGVPALVAVQASRDVDARDWKLPRMDDNQWSSAVEQASDMQFSIWRPWKTEPPGSTLDMPDGREVTVTPELFILGVRKQRGEEAGHLWPMRFEPEKLKLSLLELNKEKPRF